MFVIRKRLRPAVNPFAMSFLDTVSAGFGAAFFLFIIFASMPIEKSSGMVGSEEYIQVELEWASVDYNLELIVEAPGDDPIRLFYHSNSVAIDPITGMLMKQSAIQRWQKAFINGTSAYGKSISTRIKIDGEAPKPSKQRLSFRANGACFGDWKFLVAVKSNRDYLSNNDFQPFNITGKVFTSAIDNSNLLYKTDFVLARNVYLGEEYGSDKGQLLVWSGGPNDESGLESIHLEENRFEPMNYCNQL